MTSDTYNGILKVAARLFSRQGYTATSIRQIAQEAGIGKATIYHHFPDKKAIILALLQQNTSHPQEVLTAAQIEPDPCRRIQIVVEERLHFIFESVDLFQIVRREVPGGRDYVQSTYLAFLKEYTQFLSEAIQQGIDEGIFRPVDPGRAAQVLIIMVHGTVGQLHLSGEQIRPVGQVAAMLLDIFFDGIRKGTA